MNKQKVLLEKNVSIRAKRKGKRKLLESANLNQNGLSHCYCVIYKLWLCRVVLCRVCVVYKQLCMCNLAPQICFPSTPFLLRPFFLSAARGGPSHFGSDLFCKSFLHLISYVIPRTSFSPWLPTPHSHSLHPFTSPQALPLLMPPPLKSAPVPLLTQGPPNSRHGSPSSSASTPTNFDAVDDLTFWSSPQAMIQPARPSEAGTLLTVLLCCCNSLLSARCLLVDLHAVGAIAWLFR